MYVHVLRNKVGQETMKNRLGNNSQACFRCYVFKLEKCNFKIDDYGGINKLVVDLHLKS